MNYRQHLLVGVSFVVPFVVSLFYVFDLPELFIFYSVGLGLFACLLPDVDHSQSKIHRWILSFIGLFLLVVSTKYFIGRVRDLYALFMGVGVAFTGVFSVNLLSGFLLRHRGFTHSFVSLILSSALVYWFVGSYLAVVFALGYFTHLLADLEIKLV